MNIKLELFRSLLNTFGVVLRNFKLILIFFRFLSKSFIGFVAFNVLSYSFLTAELLLVSTFLNICYIHKCYNTINFKVFIESTLTLLNRPQRKLGQSCANSWHKIDQYATNYRMYVFEFNTHCYYSMKYCRNW